MMPALAYTSFLHSFKVVGFYVTGAWCIWVCLAIVRFVIDWDLRVESKRASGIKTGEENGTLY
jgi:hypothetical protein